LHTGSSDECKEYTASAFNERLHLKKALSKQGQFRRIQIRDLRGLVKFISRDFGGISTPKPSILSEMKYEITLTVEPR
jgi:hypothetical protein